MIKEIRNNVNKLNDMEKFIIEIEDKKTRLDRWYKIDHDLRYLFTELDNKFSELDWLHLSQIKDMFIVYSTGKEFGEYNEVFLNNIKNSFYKSCEKLIESHNDLENSLFNIILFAEDYVLKIK